MIGSVNHLTFAVRDLGESIAFYRDVLGFRLRARWAKGAYFSAGDTWVALLVDAHARQEKLAEYTHVAFSVRPEDFARAAERIRGSGCEVWKENSSEGASLYFIDPNGHKLEIHASDLEGRLASLREAPYEGLELYD